MALSSGPFAATATATTTTAQQVVKRARRAAASLLLFQGVLHDPVADAFLSCLDALEMPPTDQATLLLQRYGQLFHALARWHVANAARWIGPELDLWAAYIVQRLLGDENPWSLAVQSLSSGKIPARLAVAAEHDLTALQHVAACTGAIIREAMHDSLKQCGDGTVLESLPPAWSAIDANDDIPLADVVALLVAADNWAISLPDLARHVATQGSGIFAIAQAFHWDRAVGLRPVQWPDTSGTGRLIGYDDERAALAANTERLLDGRPAHDVLLYGARGTGKSSAVKALLPLYAGRGLHIIEVPRDSVDDISRICDQLRGRAGAFVLFVDDLSFEENETQYKGLKAMLEGGIVARPANVRLYATSNRRHLIKERFADRAGPLDDELHTQDTKNEKLSLSDRFGLALFFPAPDQPLFLSIVQGLVEQRGLSIEPATLRATALRAAQWHSGRSGRVARQIVDDIEAESRQERGIIPQDTLH